MTSPQTQKTHTARTQARTNPSTSTPHADIPIERELPMLAGIGAFVTWCEDLLAVLSGPILTAGLAIALVDLLSDGQLFTRLPMLLWVWAGSMALGLDAQFIGSSAKLARAMRHRRPYVATGYGILCLALGYVAFLATYVFAVQQANGITTTEALARLGMDSTTWIFQRSVLAVVLVFLSGLLRYVPPAVSVAADSAEERERLEAEIALEPLRQQLRNQKMRGARATVLVGLGREQQPAQTMKPHIVAASATLPPEMPPMEHHTAAILATHNAMHDWQDDEILDEVEDESDLFSTRKMPAVHVRANSSPKGVTGDTKQRTPRGTDSGPTRGNGDRSKSLKKANAELREEAKRLRRSKIRDAVYSILDEWYASGQTERLSDKELTRRVQARVDFDVNPSGNTVARWRGPWQSSRAHKAALLDGISNEIPDEVEPMEPQELRELQEAW